MTKEECLVLAFTDVDATQYILEKFFGAAPDDTILFANKYFTASVTLRIMHQPEHDLLLSDEGLKHDLSNFPAVVLLSSDQQAETISECKRLWEAIRVFMNDDAVRMLFVEGQHMNEEDTYNLQQWGVSRQIEVVNTFLCREDAIDLSFRVTRILECAAWSNVSCNATLEEETAPESSSKSAVDDHIRNRTALEKDLSKPTRLRRGLQKSDVTRLVDDLLLVDDTDSDT